MSIENTVVVFRRGYRLQWEVAQDCHVILYPEGMAKLNETAALILEQVDGKRSVSQIIDLLNHRFPDAEGVDADVIDFLQAAVKQKWIMLRDAN
ncbi:pyrroloquinoline quinone biosynthesis peptide chaperone PqqD [Tatumella saanichensis]|uniref:pyrroloquinoline quinone biosynthesis peptide chaperone PqqD n=1 Tax=Tatumella saanichensis TaxID=480813 RepID=UPI0004A3DA0F|nr:pyrroloquinoline quinone biosynthesis peptide chaperone PqqD [Tatumella saanichensis]